MAKVALLWRRPEQTETMEKDDGRSISLSKGRKRSRSGAGRGSGNHHPPTHQDDGGSAKTTVVDKTRADAGGIDC